MTDENLKFKTVLNYIGSKFSLLNFIEYVVNKETEDCKIFGDLFAGTGIVGTYFKTKGFKIISNDIQYYSYVINKKFLNVNSMLKFKDLENEIVNLNKEKGKNRILFILNYLNNLNVKKKGFIFKNYSLKGTKGKEFERQYFTDENALQIDTIRIKIQEWFDNKKINEEEYFYLLGTLLEAADKVANTASVYGAFLKHYKKAALKELKLEYNEIYNSNQKNKVYNNDILEVAKIEKFDIVYLDPPYNARQYCSNYHILETIGKYDNPGIRGKTGLRDYEEQKSNYCSKAKVKEEFKDLIKSLSTKYILISYNNEGLMSIEDVQDILSIRGTPITYTLDYKRFKADKTENRNHKANKTKEYLHFVKCNNEKFEPKIVNLSIEDLNNG